AVSSVATRSAMPWLWISQMASASSTVAVRIVTVMAANVECSCLPGQERTRPVKTPRLIIVAVLAVSVSGLAAQTSNVGELGTITFPTSAKPAAQAPFLTGVKALYNFEFDTAADVFRQAQKADPDFALAYWGEAMSFNHPLWAQQD